MGCGITNSNNDSGCNWFTVGYRYEHSLLAPEATSSFEANYLRILRGTINLERGPDVFLYAGAGIGRRTNSSISPDYFTSIFSSRAGLGLSWTDYEDNSYISGHNFRLTVGAGARSNVDLLAGTYSVSPEVWADFSLMTVLGVQVFYHGLNTEATGAPTLGFSIRAAIPIP